MYLIQIFLPLRDNAGRRIAAQHFERLAQQLGDRFGGLTAYVRAPATGLWKKSGRRTDRDQMVIYEVMSPRLERQWWGRQRIRLEGIFRQEKILIRSLRVTQL